MRSKRAFTLIELLVTVAIIALLIALLLPTLAKAREVTKKTRCLANLHQIGIALRTYGNQNADIVPTKSYAGLYSQQVVQNVNLVNSFISRSWCEQLLADGDLAERANQTYSTILPQYAACGIGVFLCPSALDNPYAVKYNAVQSDGQAYGLNPFAASLMGQAGDGTPYAPDPSMVGKAAPNPPYSGNYGPAQALMRFANLISGHIMAADGWANMASGTPWYPSGGTVFTSRYGLFMRHFNAPNYLFVDGHAEWSEKFHILKVPTASPLLNPEPWQQVQPNGSLQP